MANLADLLASLDDDDRKAIEDALGEKDQLIKEKSRAERDLRLATDSKLRQAYPRAFRAYELKELDFGDTTGEADLVAILKTQEEKLARLGVPVSLDPSPAGAAGMDAQGAEPAPDPAAAFGVPVGGGQPTGSRNLTQEFLESMRADSDTDRAKMTEVVLEMNRKGAQEDIDRLVDTLNSQRGPRGPKTVVW